ncbi:hypothetical protein ACFV0L_18940 [Streptosporangium canum]|uniref:hypothetical protein n=1 Tax=Streptosporangium canum TaxID=324952 RepID=UPI0036AB9CD7
MAYEPNRTAAQIVERLKKDGFTVTIPDKHYRRVYELTLDRRMYFGVLYISADKGRALRISLTWQPDLTNRTAEGASQIIGLLNTLPTYGWAN